MITHKIIKYVPPPVQQRVFPFTPNRMVVSPVDLAAHLARFPFQPGDWLVYRTVLEHTKELSAAKCSVLVSIDQNVSKVTGWHNTPKPFLLMQLTGTSELHRDPDYKYSRDPWCRYDDGMGMVMVGPEEREKMNDDYVQNYIKEHLPKALTYLR